MSEDIVKSLIDKEMVKANIPKIPKTPKEIALFELPKVRESLEMRPRTPTKDLKKKHMMKSQINMRADNTIPSPRAGLTRGMSVNLTPESQSILNMLGGEVNSIINDAIIQKGAERGIIPSMIITPDGAKRVEVAGGSSMQNNGKSNDAVQINSFDEIESMMAKMMRMKMMKQMIDDMSNTSSRNNKNDEDGFPNINKMLQLNIAKSMIKDMSGTKEEKDTFTNSLNVQLDNLKKEINDAKKWEELVKSLKGDETRKFGYEELIKLQSERDRQIEQMRIDAQKTKDDMLMQQFNHKLENLQGMLSSSRHKKDDFNELADTVTAVKSLAEQLSGKAPEKSKSDIAKELLQAAMPALSPLAEAAGERLRAQNAQQQYPAELAHYQKQSPDSMSSIHSEINSMYNEIREEKEKLSTAQVI